jgi:hypothetical protein
VVSKPGSGCTDLLPMGDQRLLQERPLVSDPAGGVSHRT